MSGGNAQGSNQNLMALLSVVFAVIQALVFIIAWVVPDEAPWAVFIFLWVVAVIFAVVGIVLGAIGLSQADASTRKLPLIGLIANIAVVLFFVLSIAVWAMWEYF